MTCLSSECLVLRRYPSVRPRPVSALWASQGGPGVDDDGDGSITLPESAPESSSPSPSSPSAPKAPPRTSRKAPGELQRKAETASTPDPFAASGGGVRSLTSLKQQQQANDDDDAQQPELMRTLKGGPALIFELARRSIMFVHDFDDTNVSTPQTAQPAILARKATKRRRVLPRWHPHGGISDANPKFRKEAPAMTNSGFAKSIWRNARKSNKPQLWQQAFRTYERMSILENDLEYQRKMKIQRANIHHEGALVACAKLGLWQQALEIYHYVWQQEQEGQQDAVSKQQRPSSSPSFVSSPPFVSTSVPTVTSTVGVKTKTRKKREFVTDNMILSLVRACVRASRSRSKNKSSSTKTTKTRSEALDAEAALRRIPLDTAQQVLSTMQEEHGIPLMAHFVNPLAAAYQSLGYYQEARHVLRTMLANRTASEEEPEIGAELLNVHDLWAKDKGSYSLLVQGELASGDYGAAIEALQEMTSAGLYPDRKNANVWSEISLRQTRPRFVGSRKKKRDDYWTDRIL